MAFFTVDEIDQVSDTFFNGMGHDEGWAQLERSTLALPEWYIPDLDPFSQEYYDQQIRLWKTIAGEDRAYDPAIDEAMAERTPDIIRHPGYFRWRHDGAIKDAGNHIRGAGAILANGNLKAGQWALEYGAGYGLIALNLARMGVHVDTVDISDEFCAFVQMQADFYKVPLTPFNVPFGSTPREGQKYDLIYFFESFHHCSDLHGLLSSVRKMLAPGGRVILAAEPIHFRPNDAIPYAWGLRLDAPTVAVVRRRKWFELGFTEEFIMELFKRHGFTCRRMEGMSEFDTGYIFESNTQSIRLASSAANGLLDGGWHPAEASGRWTKAKAAVAIAVDAEFETLDVHVTNHHAVDHPVTFRFGDQAVMKTLSPGQSTIVSINAEVKADRLVIECKPVVPAAANPRSDDTRQLGVHVKQIDYQG